MSLISHPELTHTIACSIQSHFVLLPQEFDIRCRLQNTEQVQKILVDYLVVSPPGESLMQMVQSCQRLCDPSIKVSLQSMILKHASPMIAEKVEPSTSSACFPISFHRKMILHDSVPIYNVHLTVCLLQILMHLVSSAPDDASMLRELRFAGLIQNEKQGISSNQLAALASKRSIALAKRGQTNLAADFSNYAQQLLDSYPSTSKTPHLQAELNHEARSSPTAKVQPPDQVDNESERENEHCNSPPIPSWTEFHV